MSFSKLQKQQYKEIKELFANCDSKAINLTDEDDVRLRRVLDILIDSETIRRIEVDGGNMYVKLTSFETFEEVYKDDVREEKKMSKREWRIAIISAIIGGIIGLIPTVISLFMN